MKLALCYIPTEVWVDVFIFPWITRKRLGKIAHRFKNRKFVEILQYCLHDRGKRMLSDLDLDKKLLYIPRTPMPENIKFFRGITIWHFDSSALYFLHRISTLFTGVNLDLMKFRPEDDLTNLRTTFDHLAPLIHGIHALSINECAIPLVEQYFALKLTQIKMISLSLGIDGRISQATIDFALNWLTSEERDKIEPRMLVVPTDSSECFQQISMAVQQQFYSTKRPCTFAIRLISCFRHPIPQFHLENNLGEQLHGEYEETWVFRINRHQPNAGTAQQEWVEQTDDKAYGSSVIWLQSSLTIGPIDANVDANQVDVVEEEEEEQPSTSEMSDKLA